MKDNARHVPGSSRSCRTPLSRSATPTWRFEAAAKSTYKIQTKCIQNRQGEFLIHSASVTYNFNRVKCLHFPAPRSALAIEKPTAVAETASSLALGAAETKSLGRCNDPKLVRVRGRLVLRVQRSRSGNLAFGHCIKMNIISTKMNTAGGGGVFKNAMPNSCEFVVGDKMGNFETNSHSVPFRARRTRRLQQHRIDSSHFAQTLGDTSCFPAIHGFLRGAESENDK